LTSKDFILVEGAIGYDSAMTLSYAVGGVQFRVPDKPNEHLLELFGKEQAHELCQELGSTILNLPSRLSIERMQRNANIKKMIDAGETNRQIAHVTGVTMHWVRRVRGAHGNRI
jgi:hypothetical protein